VPWLSGTVGIVVDTRRVRDTIRTWADVFSGKYAGKIVIVDDPREMVAWALASLDLPINDVSNEALAKVQPVLEKWLPQVKVFDSDNPKSAIIDGRAEIGIVWSGEAALLWVKNRRYEYVLPQEGAHRFIDSLAIPKGAPHKVLAEDFINYCLNPDVSVQISNAYPYTNPNAAARKLLSKSQLANPASYPPHATELPTLRNIGNTTPAVAEFVHNIRESLKTKATPEAVAAKP
jgi:spermidine/putrescine transport system substrate-binding protein